ncbi:TPA: hypothetical protein ACF5RG_003585 [Providencia alcalifaciens]
MIYQTGTIKTTAGQTKITGTGTRWKDNLAGISEGCPISYLINNTVFMNTVLSVNSDTEINLTYPVPATADKVNYQIATFVSDSMSDGVRKMLANQQYIGYFLRNMDAWLTQDGIVEVKTPTGETVRLESLVELKKQIDGKLNKTGGTITKNSDALNLKNASENQALFMGFFKSDGVRRGYVGAPSDKDRISVVNDVSATALTLTEDKQLTFQGEKILTSPHPKSTNSWEAKQYSTPMWLVASTDRAGWVKIAEIGDGGRPSGNSRYLFQLNCTNPSFTSRGNVPSFGTLSVTIGNGNNPSRNFEATYFCTDHFGITNADSRIMIKQVSSFKAEVWVVLGSYSRLSCSCLTTDVLVPCANVFVDVLAPVDNGEQSVYGATNNYVYATANRYGNVESKDTMKVTASGNYPRLTLARADGTYVNLEADVPSNGNMANLIHRNQSNANIAVIAFPNRNGTAMLAGDFGWGGRGEGVAQNWTTASVTEHFRVNASTIWRTEAANDWTFRYCPNLMFKTGDTFANIGVDIYTGIVKTSAGITANTTSYKTNLLYGTANTTKDTNGNLKAASPIIKVFADHIELNDESEGVTLKKLHTGIYQLHGVLGLHSDASWGGIHGGITIPCGINQMPLVYALYDVLEKGEPHPFDGRIVEPDEDGDIVLYTTYRKHDLPQNIQYERFKLYPEFLKEVDGEMVELTPGEPCDIPNGHWIDVRVNMPSDSIYNQKLAEAERLAKLEAERIAKEEAEKVASDGINE